MPTFAARNNHDLTGLILQTGILTMTRQSTSMTTALAGSGARLRTRLGHTLARVTGLDALVKPTVQSLATDLTAGRLGDVTGNVGHLGLAAHTRLSNKDNTRRTRLAIWVAGVS
jgi:hypothetical protein